MMKRETSPPEVLLAIRGLRHRYGDVEALRGLDLEIRAGEVVALLGSNGAGKTTLLRLICGLIELQQGEIKHGGKDPRQIIGLCPQDDRLFLDLTCMEQLHLMGRLHGMPSGQLKDRARSVLVELDLEPKEDALASTLSGGMKRRLSLAMALLHDPALLVLDEPDAGLDPQSRIALRGYIKALAHEQGKGLLLATHSLDEVEKIADRVLILDKGKIVVDGPPRQLIAAAGVEGPNEAQVEFELGSEQGGQQEGLHRELLELIGPGLHYVDGRFTFRSTTPLRALATLEPFIVRHGITMRRLHVRPRDLEDVFIEVTGQRYAP